MARIRTIGAALALASSLLGAGNANAVAIYSYIGNLYSETGDSVSIAGVYDTSQRVTGYFTLATALGSNLAYHSIQGDVLSVSLSDGRNTFTITDPDLLNAAVEVSTDALGNISTWLVQLEVGELLDHAGASVSTIATSNRPARNIYDLGHVSLCEIGNGFGACQQEAADFGQTVQDPGQWTLSVTNEVPEPVALALLVPALVALRRFRQRD